jgi:hypothetical protein
MGLEVAAVVMAGIAVGAKVGQMNMEYNAAQQKEKSLDLQSKQQTLAYQQKTLSNYDVMEKVIDAQTAAMTTRGVAFSSPSFNAIQRNTMNIGSKQQRNIDIENDLSQANIDIEKENVQNTLYAQLFGDVSSLAMEGLGMYSKMPSKGG